MDSDLGKKRQSERIEFISTDGEKQTHLIDISATGACVLVKNEKKEHSFLVAKVNGLSIRARVIYCQPRRDGYRVGLQFWDVPSDKAIHIKKFVEDYSRGVPLSCEIFGDNSGSEA